MKQPCTTAATTKNIPLRRLFFVFCILIITLLGKRNAWGQDRLPHIEALVRSFDIGLTASTFCSPKIYGERIISSNPRLYFGGDYFVNLHFTRHIGLNMGIGIFSFKKPVIYTSYEFHDISHLTFKFSCIKLPINFLWNINPVSKMRCFILAGFSPAYIYSNYHLDDGSPILDVPSRIMNSYFRIFYNLSMGFKIPIYQSFAYTLMLKYENTFKPLQISYIPAGGVYSKKGFLSLNMGFYFKIRYIRYTTF